MQHQIKLEELIDWELQEQVLFASSSKEQKQFKVGLINHYYVYHKKELVFSSANKLEAVKFYNNI